MDDLLDDDFGEPGSGRNEPEYTVSEISGAVKRALEDRFGRIRVKGEIGRIFRARSGHLYYDVKDDRNVLACTTWKGQIAQLSVAPEEGMEVVVTGRLSGFGAQSKYNLNVDTMQVAGAGALMAMLDKRRRALEAEGLFDPARKRPLPFLPDVIGVITSPQGAVIRDILHRLRDRFPRRVLVWPVAVQGKACAREVANAIRGFNALAPGGAIPRPDLLIVARGGGSIEDLWGFNEEAVVRAAADSVIPLISAVGHETDTTLIDHASDRRAPHAHGGRGAGRARAGGPDRPYRRVGPAAGPHRRGGRDAARATAARPLPRGAAGRRRFWNGPPGGWRARARICPAPCTPARRRRASRWRGSRPASRPGRFGPMSRGRRRGWTGRDRVWTACASASRQPSRAVGRDAPAAAP